MARAKLGERKNPRRQKPAAFQPVVFPSNAELAARLDKSAGDRCSCAKGAARKRCSQFDDGLIFWRGQHHGYAEIAAIILKMPHWRGAEVTHDAGLMIVRKGTAEMRLRGPRAADAAPAPTPVSYVVNPCLSRKEKRALGLDQALEAGARAVELASVIVEPDARPTGMYDEVRDTIPQDRWERAAMFDQEETQMHTDRSAV